MPGCTGSGDGLTYKSSSNNHTSLACCSKFPRRDCATLKYGVIYEKFNTVGKCFVFLKDVGHLL